MKKIVLAILLVSSRWAAAAPQDVLEIGISAEFESLNPLIATQAAAKYILYLSTRPMVVLTPDLKWKAMGIKEVPSLENKLVKRKGEGLEMNFEIIPTAQWGDGTPLTCRDIEFSWKVGKSNNVSIGNREAYEVISSISWDKNNPKKCTLVLSKLKFDFFTYIPDPLPAHLEAPIFEKHSGKPQGYDQNTLYTKQPTHPGLYYGPYVISEVKLGSHVIFTPNPKWLGKKPYFKRIVIKLIPNNGTLEANLRSGNINMISSSAALGIDQAVIFDKKVKAENLPYDVIFEEGVIYAHIDMNLDNPILADLNVRKALVHGFNKKAMIDALLEGKGKVAYHFVTDRDPWYTENVQKYEFSRRTAGKLLDEAGWKLGDNGYRSKNGKRLSLQLMGAAGSKLNEMIQAYLQEEYKALGIELKLKNEPPRVFFGETVNQRKFDLAMYSWVSNPENSPRSTLHSTSIPSAKNSWAGQNYTGYKNKDVDKWIDQLEQELDPKKRATTAQKIVNQYTQDLPVIPVYYRPNNAVNPKGLKGFRLSGHQFYETLNVEDWYF